MVWFLTILQTIAMHGVNFALMIGGGSDLAIWTKRYSRKRAVLFLFDCKKNGENNKIRLITMMLRSNKDEIIDIIERVHREISPVVHELRTPYVSAPIEEFLNKEMLSQEELYVLYEKINKLGYEEVVLDFGRDKEELQRHIERRKLNCGIEMEKDINPAYRVRIEPNGLETLEIHTTEKEIKNFTYRVRINSDGTGYFVDTDDFLI